MILVMISGKTRQEWEVSDRAEAMTLGVRYLREGHGRKVSLYRGDRARLVWQRSNTRTCPVPRLRLDAIRRIAAKH